MLLRAPAARSPWVAVIGDNVGVTTDQPDVASVPGVAPASVDAVLAAAVDLAREAAVEVSGDEVGEHLGVTADAERIATHAFAATLPGYTGWYWAVTLARASRAKNATVDEVVLLPGGGALLAPAWVPWQERLRPGDLAPGDLLPPVENDPRLVPAYASDDDSEDPQVDAVAWELGLGRERVLSREGRLDSAERWQSSDVGPDTAMARQAPARCGTCGFLVPLSGSMRAAFGVCCNELTATDGRAVSVEFGCGAHSQVVVPGTSVAEITEPVYDDGDEVLELDRPSGAAVPADDGVTDQAEDPAGETSP